MLSHSVHPSNCITVHAAAYTLYSIARHRGEEQFGHYWAIVQHMFEGGRSWWVDDDSLRNNVDGPAWKEQRCSSRVYKLFYVCDSGAAPQEDMSGASSNTSEQSCAMQDKTARAANAHGA
eukprot:9666869-Karenia_brevis.AAC.1